METAKQMAENILKASKEKTKRNIKDSVFCDLFSIPEYLLQLYRALHPEDTEINQDDLTIITLSSTFIRAMYNDLGFLAGNRLIILVEEQSSWSYNLPIRMLEYLAETYRRYMEQNGLNKYREKAISLPKPELYVIYTGEQGEKPVELSLKDIYWGVESCCVDVIVKVIYDSVQGDILNQFIVFTRVFDEQRKKYPDDPRKAIQETIRICKEKDVLKAYLEREEAATVMYTFMDQEKAFMMTLDDVREEGREEGLEVGRAEGREEGAIQEAVKLYNEEMGLSPLQIMKKIMDRFDLNEDDAKSYVEDTLGVKLELEMV